MLKLRLILLCTVTASLAAGIAPAGAETTEEFRNNRPKISRSGQIGSFNFFGSAWKRSRRNTGNFGELPIRNRSGSGSSTQIYTYAPDRLYRLGDSSAKQPARPHPVFATQAPEGFNPTPAELRSAKLDDSLAQTIFDLIKSGQTGVKVTKAQASAIAAFYKKRSYGAIWTTMDGLEAHARDVLELLRDAGAEGFNADDYALAVLNEFGNDIDRVESDLGAIARFDIQLTAMAVRYAMHASGGRITANRLSGYHDLKPATVSAARALNKLARASQPDRYLASLHPKHKAYAQLKAALARQNTDRTPVEVVAPVPPGPTITPGQFDERVPGIRHRMIKDGHLAARKITVTPSSGEEIPSAVRAVIRGSTDDVLNDGDALYDGELVAAVKKFQRAAGLRPDGIIGRRTIRALNGKAEKQFNKARRIIANMERLRWLPKNLGRKHVFVNQASFQVRVMNNGRQVWKSRVIVGKPSNQTSFFSDVMETVVFNPYWGVPQSIITKEMLPKLVNDPGYLDRQGYEVYYGSGQRVRSSNVDWWNYYGRAPMSVRQPPGRKNALGQIKFLFPNKHAIYLHDTPTKKLFERDNRAYSHGCVRVQDPRKLAEAVLGWDRERIDSHIATGRNQKVELDRKLPVHLTYFTAWPNAAGKISYHQDTYGRDTRLELAFAATTAAFR